MYVRWFDRAERYYRLAHELFERGYYPESCFYAQQSIEFLLKGLMIKFLGVRPYTHDLIMIYESIKEFINRELDDKLRRCLKFLSEQYMGSRYPDVRIIEYDIGEARECIECLEGLWNVFKTI